MLPPEVNSGRMYAGAGSGPMVAAAAAWDGLAAELTSAATSYQATVSQLIDGPWVGPSSTSMAAAAAPYVSWMSSTAAQAEHTANQLRSAVAAYEAAFAATVPPPEIEVNRAMLASLVATNILGQNTPWIAALEAQYAQMWAQDAAAMYGYAGASAAATTLAPFTSPTPNSDPAAAGTQAGALAQATASATGTGTQSTLSQALSSVPNLLQNLASGASVDPITSLQNILTSPLGTAINRFGSDVGNVATEFSGFAFVASGFTPMFSPFFVPHVPPVFATTDLPAAPEGALATGLSAPASAGSGSAGLSAGVGEAASVGKLSVPPAWRTASPAVRLATETSPLPGAGMGGAPQAEAAGPGGFYGGIPPVGSLVNAPRGDQNRPRSGVRQKVIPELAREQGADEPVAARPAQRQRSVQTVASSLSGQERDELDQLRKELAELATERDAAARLIKEAMW